MSESDAARRVRRELRRIRQEQGLTLAEVSRASGVSISTLSKVETGQAAPTFDTMLKIARALGVSFENLLGSPPRYSGSGVRALTRRGEATSFDTARYAYDVHATELRRKKMIPLIMEIEADAPPGPEDWSSHPGEEFIYVLEGRIELHTALYEPVVLGPGESAYIDSAMPHGFVRLGEGPARMLSICYGDLDLTRERLERLAAGAAVTESADQG
jgi:transcriptional regulator with XRE-family HTH domain